VSYVVIGRMKVDPAVLEGLFASRRSDFEEVAETAKKAGALHHRFLRGDGEVVILDEWESPEAFSAFFDAQPQIGSLMQEAGVQGPPEFLVLSTMESPDRF